MNNDIPSLVEPDRLLQNYTFRSTWLRTAPEPKLKAEITVLSGIEVNEVLILCHDNH
jgi:hypothetical protein